MSLQPDGSGRMAERRPDQMSYLKIDNTPYIHYLTGIVVYSFAWGVTNKR